MSKIDDLKKIIKESNNIVFFGGAGVSTESNIPDFRSADGLYNTMKNKEFSPEYLLSSSCLYNDTEYFYEFYQSSVLVPNAEPNKAHYALAKLEELGKLKAVITQNIDGLHQKAGSKNVIELHGSIMRNYCLSCNTPYDALYMLENKGITKCEKCGGMVRPDVVLYGEMLDDNAVSEAVNYISESDVLIIGGTSLVVYPAAGLLRYYNGKKLILINKSETSYDSMALLSFNESIGSVLEEVVKDL